MSDQNHKPQNHKTTKRLMTAANHNPDWTLWLRTINHGARRRIPRLPEKNPARREASKRPISTVANLTRWLTSAKAAKTSP